MIFSHDIFFAGGKFLLNSPGKSFSNFVFFFWIPYKMRGVVEELPIN